MTPLITNLAKLITNQLISGSIYAKIAIALTIGLTTSAISYYYVPEYFSEFSKSNNRFHFSNDQIDVKIFAITPVHYRDDVIVQIEYIYNKEQFCKSSSENITMIENWSIQIAHSIFPNINLDLDPNYLARYERTIKPTHTIKEIDILVDWIIDQFIQYRFSNCKIHPRNFSIHNLFIKAAYASQTKGDSVSNTWIDEIKEIISEDLFLPILRAASIFGAMIAFIVTGAWYVFGAQTDEKRKRSLAASSYLGTFLVGVLFG